MSEIKGSCVVGLAEGSTGLPIINPVIETIVEVAACTIVVSVVFNKAGCCNWK